MRCGYLLPFALLIACTSHGLAKPSAERAATLYMSIHNDGDRQAARALWGTRWGIFWEPTEWFRDRVGECISFTPMHVTDDLHARFLFECERGQLEIEFNLDQHTGVVKEHQAGARGVEPPARVRQTAEQMVAYAKGENATYPHLASSFDHDDFDEVFDQISAQGPCKIDRVHLGSLRNGRFVLECASGPMTMLVDLTPGGALRGFTANDGAADQWREQG